MTAEVKLKINEKKNRKRVSRQLLMFQRTNECTPAGICCDYSHYTYVREVADSVRRLDSLKYIISRDTVMSSQ
jgi:hypothetical protein